MFEQIQEKIDLDGSVFIDEFEIRRAVALAKFVRQIPEEIKTNIGVGRNRISLSKLLEAFRLIDSRQPKE